MFYLLYSLYFYFFLNIYNFFLDLIIIVTLHVNKHLQPFSVLYLNTYSAIFCKIIMLLFVLLNLDQAGPRSYASNCLRTRVASRHDNCWSLPFFWLLFIYVLYCFLKLSTIRCFCWNKTFHCTNFIFFWLKLCYMRVLVLTVLTVFVDSLIIVYVSHTNRRQLILK